MLSARCGIANEQHRVTGRAGGAIGQGTVVAVAERNDPAAGTGARIVRLHDRWLAEREAHVRIVGVRELPQDRALRVRRRLGSCEARRARDVERVDALAALIQAAGEDRVPGTAPVRVAHARRTVDEVLVHIVLLRQLREACPGRRSERLPHRRRDERKHFGAGIGVEPMHHAVVRAGVDHGRALGGGIVRGDEGRVGNAAGSFQVVAVAERWPADEQRRRRDDVAQLAREPRPELAGQIALVGAVAAQIFEQRLAIDLRLARGVERAPAEGDLAAGGVARDDLPRIPGRQLLGRVPCRLRCRAAAVRRCRACHRH